eukprot:GHVL01009117.1.p1 GENE.GHVL01009117.1~~GHVL01009117.1.p1  ORF type:complete len:178 (+),score=34.45 GHVL01009117.1:35-535(+)
MDESSQIKKRKVLFPNAVVNTQINTDSPKNTNKILTKEKLFDLPIPELNMSIIDSSTSNVDFHSKFCSSLVEKHSSKNQISNISKNIDYIHIEINPPPLINIDDIDDIHVEDHMLEITYDEDLNSFLKDKIEEVHYYSSIASTIQWGFNIYPINKTLVDLATLTTA